MTAPLSASYNDMVFIKRLQDTLLNGNTRGDRTGTGTVSTFGGEDKYDLDNAFPLLCWRYVATDPIKGELVGFVKGATNAEQFRELGCNYWNPWANAAGELGPIYGQMWCSWPGTNGAAINQLDDIIHALRTTPESRRLVVSAWNPSLLPDAQADHDTNIANGKQVLPPCHTLFQFYSQVMTDEERRSVWANAEVRDAASIEKLYDYTGDALAAELDERGVPKRALSCKLHQRSCDYILGGFINIPSYATLVYVIAKMTGHHPLEFLHSLGDNHVYADQRECALEIIDRASTLESDKASCTLSRDVDPATRTRCVIAERVATYDSITQLELDDINYVNHYYLPKMTIPVAV